MLPRCIFSLLISSSRPSRIVIPNTIRQTCWKSPLKAGFVSEASSYLPERYADPLQRVFTRKIQILSFLCCLRASTFPECSVKVNQAAPTKTRLRDASAVAKVCKQHASCEPRVSPCSLSGLTLGLSCENSTWGLEKKNAATASV